MVTDFSTTGKHGACGNTPNVQPRAGRLRRRPKGSSSPGATVHCDGGDPLHGGRLSQLRRSPGGARRPYCADGATGGGPGPYRSTGAAGGFDRTHPAPGFMDAHRHLPNFTTLGQPDQSTQPVGTVRSVANIHSWDSTG
jgi:hypothetical protein